MTREFLNFDVMVLVESLTRTVWIIPKSELVPGSYVLQLAPPLADMAGNPLAQSYQINFTVGSGGRIFLPVITR